MDTVRGQEFDGTCEYIYMDLLANLLLNKTSQSTIFTIFEEKRESCKDDQIVHTFSLPACNLSS